MSGSSILKFFLGLFIAVGILAAGGLVTARVMIARFSAPPPKPIYPNDKPAAKATQRSPESAKSTALALKPLPAGAFEAKVTQSIGLVMRDTPGGSSVGGVEYNDRVTVLETSQDGTWQRIRLANDREGWVKAGNIEQVN